MPCNDKGVATAPGPWSVSTKGYGVCASDSPVKGSRHKQNTDWIKPGFSFLPFSLFPRLFSLWRAPREAVPYTVLFQNETVRYKSKTANAALLNAVQGVSDMNEKYSVTNF